MVLFHPQGIHIASLHKEARKSGRKKTKRSAQLGAEGHSISHRARVKSAVGGFARWLIEEKSLLRRNPARQVTIPPQPLLAPRELTLDERYVLGSLVEREDACRGAALYKPVVLILGGK
jgi:site-specific recombinase XerC